jgi:hypothetical protein
MPAAMNSATRGSAEPPVLEVLLLSVPLAMAKRFLFSEAWARTERGTSGQAPISR